MIYPVVLCGGSGTRLWPLSRKSYPKQFSPLMGEESLYQATLRRFHGNGFAQPMVLTGNDFRFIAAEQLSNAGFSEANILIEPEGRNTAPAILCAALMLKDEPDALMLVAPSDHVIDSTFGFLACVEAGAPAAKAGSLVTFGIKPTRPETGYGYLELNSAPVFGQQATAVPLSRFVEKPGVEAANKMLASGNFLWNAGIFLFSVEAILAAFETCAPDLLEPCQNAVSGGKTDLMFFRLQEEAYRHARDVSIDYAVMEKAANLMAVPFDGGWSDLGSWDAVWMKSDPDEKGLAIAGPVTALDCTNSLLRSEDESLRLVGVGLDNIAAVAMRDAVLIAPLSETQRVKDVVAALKIAKVPQAEEFPLCHRPWGYYQTLMLSDRFQVKEIVVKPGAALSLQSHHHRSEHWVVVSGAADVVVGEEEQFLSENESVYIPVGTKHRLANPGKVHLHLIEVQTGAYLGEDDIVRYEDVYNRS
ncbi:MAG TPA: mannose-1-phosphate guanylyltransferase/mannose-6-phosphate isomerase [Alphaproteobacteria bacterium]|nr:mannose-1-phosphate guanylyltransferase/mannose-6-phosphate isomerase [Alphaproteobacteria bacterium]